MTKILINDKNQSINVLAISKFLINSFIDMSRRSVFLNPDFLGANPRSTTN